MSKQEDPLISQLCKFIDTTNVAFNIMTPAQILI